MKCATCGAEVTSNDISCPKCGATLKLRRTKELDDHVTHLPQGETYRGRFDRDEWFREDED